jgi:hypothetical protein
MFPSTQLKRPSLASNVWTLFTSKTISVNKALFPTAPSTSTHKPALSVLINTTFLVQPNACRVETFNSVFPMEEERATVRMFASNVLEITLIS